MINYEFPVWRVLPSAGNNHQLWRIMKLMSFLLLWASLHVSAASLSQTVTLKADSKPLTEVLATLEKQTGYRIMYNDRFVKPTMLVSVDVNREPLADVLDRLLRPKRLSYHIEGSTIAIHRMKTGQPAIQLDVKRVEPQERIISGKVTDAQGNPLEGVTVSVKGTSVALITDSDGNYRVTLPEGGTVLIFTIVGYEKQEISVGHSTTVNAALRQSISDLEEVVVIGYGTQSQKRVSGSVANVQMKDFNAGVNRDAAGLLRGKVAGLTITSGSGDVSSGETIRLRGTASLTGSSAPFVVIDGVPGLPMSSVAPQDIESISVLKDASASAIYGSRSASGVILITTKTGKGKARINYEGYGALETVSNKPRMLTADEWRQFVSTQDMDVTGLDLGGNTNWFDEILRRGVSQNHSLSLTGGGTNNSYRASFNYLSRQGIAKGNDLDNLNGRLTFNQKALNDRLDITLTGAITQRDYSPTDDRNFVLAYNMIPVYPVKNDDGSWFEVQGYDQGNPLHNIMENRRDYKNSLYYFNAQTKIRILDGLTGSLNLHKERENSDYGSYNDSETERGRDDRGFASRSFWTRDRKLMETTLNYHVDLSEAHNLEVLGGYSYEEGYYQNAGGQSRQFITDLFEYNNLGAGEILRAGDVWSGKNMYKLISFFARADYAYREKYILTTTLRRDGSSKFGEHHKWGTFPSVSAAWNIADEDFLQGTLSELKLRVGYGVVGNQEGLNPYQTLQLYAANGRYYDNGNWFQAYQIGQNPNPNLKWEETGMFNVGIDFRTANGRISGTLEYYDKQTKDLLYTYQVPVPPFLYPSMIANVGEMSNKGLELLVNGLVVDKPMFSWSVNVNLAHNKNRISRLSGNEFTTSSIKLGSASVRGAAHTTTHILEEGKEVGTFYGWRSLGLDEDGKYIMDDGVDGKPGLTDDDRTYIGSAQPKLTYGINNTFTYKQFDLSFFLRGVYGNDVLNFSRMSYATTLWLPGGNALQEALTNGLSDSPIYSSYYIEKGSFLRLDNLSLSYRFKPGAIRNIDQLRVFFTGQNLFVITNYSGLDPEVDMNGLSPGMEGRNYYPKARTVSLGLNIGF
jgi:TonB-linked outer membrane protein, SusC/RagA family